MPIDFQCPHCGLQTQVADQYSGQSGPCARCGKVVTVPDLPGYVSTAHLHQGAIYCPACSYMGEVLMAHHGYRWWTFPVSLLVILLISCCMGPLGFPFFVIAFGGLFIYLGNRTYRACPNCRNRELTPWSGIIPPQNQTIWMEAKQADERAFKRNQLTLLAIVTVILIAAVVFVVAAR